MSEKGVTTLDQFVSKSPNKVAWWKSLPEDVLDQIMASDAGSAIVAKWLQSIGIEDATRARVETLIVLRNAEREKS